MVLVVMVVRVGVAIMVMVLVTGMVVMAGVIPRAMLAVSMSMMTPVVTEMAVAVTIVLIRSVRAILRGIYSEGSSLFHTPNVQMSGAFGDLRSKRGRAIDLVDIEGGHILVRSVVGGVVRR